MFMEYQVNQSLEEMELGENEGSVFFDSETGNTHILDETAADILRCFKKENKLNKVIDMLAEIYDSDRDVIEQDVNKFIEELLKNGLLLGRSEIEN